MKSLQKPTPDLVARALARLGRPGAHAYFFDRLNNPSWIEPLAEKGFFKRPPAAEHFPSQGTVSYPDWPELLYLQRMAELAPDKVGKLVVALPDTDNVRVKQTLVRIAAKLPNPWARELGKGVGAWLDQPVLRTNFADPFPQFIAHLAGIGESKLARSIAKELFEVEQETKAKGSGRPLDSWHFERYLKQCLPDLIKSDANATFAFLIERLLTATDRDSRSSKEDYSYIWRRDILKANFTVKEDRDVLIDATRDLALELAKKEALGAEEVCRLLVVGGRPILKRIALFVASRTADPSDPIVMELLGDLNLVDRETCHAEYGFLLQAIFPRLSAPQQEKIVQLLTESDPLQAIPEETRVTLNEEKKQDYSRHFQRDRLLAFGPVLPDKLKPLLTSLLGVAGPPTENDFEIASYGAAGPLSAEQVQSMPVDELLAFINSWIPEQGFNKANPESLGQQLNVAAKARAVEFSAQASKWIGRDPTYVRWVLMGISDAIANKTQIADWTSLLELMSWILQQQDPPGAADEDPWSGRDAGWAEARRSIARLIEHALTGKESGILDGPREPVWNLLKLLLQDRDPAPGKRSGAEADRDDEQDALSVAINSTRGIAAEALFRYLWKTHPNDRNAGPLTFESVPDIRAELEKLLADKAPAIRSVFGQRLPTLFHFDFEWTSKRIDQIFPEQESMLPLWRAGWATFMDYGHPHDPAYEALRSKYEFAIARLDPESEEANKRIGERGLGRHLGSYYWRGIGGAETIHQLLRFFDRCSASAAGDIASFIGRGLQTEAAIAAETIDRLVRLWEAFAGRRNQWSERKWREVMRHFGEWFNSIHLDEQWSLSALDKCLSTGSGLSDSEGVFVRLNTLAPRYPDEVAECTRLLLQDDQRLFLTSMHQGEISALLKALLDAGSTTARAATEKIVDRLIENGSLFARDISKAQLE
jgi:hypothetical protein